MLRVKKIKPSSSPNQATQLRGVLNHLLEINKISLTQLHHNTGVALTTLKRMRSTGEANPTIQSLLPIANFFGISVDQLLGLKPLPDTTQSAGYHESKDNWAQIIIREWNDLNTQTQPTDATEYTKTDLEVSDRAYALRVNCTSWNEFSVNSILIIDPDKTPRNESYVIAFNRSSQSSSLYRLLIQGQHQYIQPPIRGIDPTPLTSDYELKGMVVQTRLDF